MSFITMISSVCQAPWFWNLRECWVQYPVQVKKPFLQLVCLSCRSILGWFWLLLALNSQVMERAHYWYYMLELGFYLSLLLRISVDVRRKVKAVWPLVTDTHDGFSLVIDTSHSIMFDILKTTEVLSVLRCSTRTLESRWSTIWPPSPCWVSPTAPTTSASAR